MKYFLLIVGVLAVLFVGLPALGLWNINFWGVKYEDARRNVFEHSKSYRHGTIRDLENLMIEYRKAEGGAKEAIRQTIIHRLSVFDDLDLPPRLRNFMEEIRG